MISARRSLLALFIAILLYVFFLTQDSNTARLIFGIHTMPSPPPVEHCDGTCITFTHVISPFTAESGSFAAVQQQIVAQSIAAAIEQARSRNISVEVFGITSPSEVTGVLPPLQPLAVLNRTLGDLLSTSVNRFPKKPLNSPLPILADILDAGYKYGQGHFLVYTNADIGLQPHFYSESALSITRRTVQRDLKSLEEIYARGQSNQTSTNHAGDDCFAFPRSWVPRLRVGDVALGYPPIGFLLRSDLRRLAGQAHFLKADPFITFHTGDDKNWTDSLPWKHTFAVHNFIAASHASKIKQKGEPNWQPPIEFVVEPFRGLCSCAAQLEGAVRERCAGMWIDLADAAKQACITMQSLPKT